MVETCTGIIIEKIRGTVEIGGYSVTTPYMKTFNISKSRSQFATTFSATLEVPASAPFQAGNDLIIKDNVDGTEKQRFKGVIRQMTVNPSYDKPGYYVINLSGADRFVDLENKRFSRRIGGYGFSMFVSITGGPKNRPTMGFSIDKTIARGSHTYTSNSPRPFGEGETSKLIKMPERGKGRVGEREKIDPLGSGGTTNVGSSTLGIHDHSTTSKGGAAFGVFSV